jgi:MraZ protein
VFSGEYQYKVDEKGRVPFPPRFREQLREGLVLARAEEKCITVYPKSVWDKQCEQLNVLPSATSAEVRQYKRLLFGTAFESEFDGQGRVTLPAPLRDHAEIGSTVILAGANNVLEIWSKENWERVSEDAGGQMSQLNDAINREHQ